MKCLVLNIFCIDELYLIAGRLVLKGLLWAMSQLHDYHDNTGTISFCFQCTVHLGLFQLLYQIFFALINLFYGTMHQDGQQSVAIYCCHIVRFL